jgi:hypothetical protein
MGSFVTLSQWYMLTPGKRLDSGAGGWSFYMAKDLPSSKSLRAGLRAANKPDRWDMEKRPVKAGYEPQQVQMHAVQDTAWQRLRLSLKGRDTTDKLALLETWWHQRMLQADEHERMKDHAPSMGLYADSKRWGTEVQVGNYLGALRRGGQLNDENQIRKAR